MSDTPRTDAVPHNVADLAMHARKLEREIDALRKDKERLDWLVDNTAISMLRKDEDGEEWWVELDYSEPRLDIDKAMEESQ